MARRPGPPPTPLALRIVKGNPSKRALPRAVKAGTLKHLRAPAGMTKDGRRWWRHYAPLLSGAGLLSPLDVTMLRALCEDTAIWLFASSKMQDGLLIRIGRGESAQAQPSPWLSIAAKAQARMMAALQEFGMSPSARTRVDIAPTLHAVPPRPDGDAGAKYFNDGTKGAK